ncbi:DUF3817 domain-containing protein [Actinoplanes rectilineatus]|uniref:DUF3817 domain-containing protein n=1 Tax=Actinoplanes rectilineatus TaxID=113571 RepID=UPI000AE9C062|nr:DUF3817 domain-containing protein [Actinoplanes rectilineatus]
MSVPRALPLAATVELVSLLVLLVNLVTVHWRPVTSLTGPVHGCAYLFVIVLTLTHRDATLRARLLVLIPGIGGLLALRLLPAGPDRA